MGLNIGVFDSGLGGLSIYQEIKKLLPKQKIIYFADHKNSPYGSRTENQIKNLTAKAIKFLEKKDCHLIVLACNTATISGIEYYRKKFSQIIFVGVVPPVKPAAKLSQNKKIVVLSTISTSKSKYLEDLINKFANDCKVLNFGCPELVELVEKANIKGGQAENSINKYLSQPLREGCDVIVLGCTHFPFLIEVIKKISGKKIEILEPSKPVAIQTLRLYQKMRPKALNFVPSEDEFYTSKNSEKVSRIASKLLKRKIGFKTAY